MQTHDATAFAQALDRYAEEFLAAMNRAPLTRKNYTEDLVKLFGFLEGQARIASVEQVRLTHLEGYLALLDRRGLSGTRRRRAVAAFRSFFTFCFKKGLTATNLAEELIPPAREHTQPRFLTEVEYKRLVEAARYDARDTAILELILQTGMRLSEVARLTIADVTLPARVTKDETGSILIHGKGRRERLITLNWKACKALKGYLAQRPAAADAHLFLTKFGAGIGPRSIENLVGKYLSEANIRGASVHSLRHTFGTHHVRKGTSLKVVQDMMGHANLATTSLYVSLARELMDKQVQENAL